MAKRKHSESSRDFKKGDDAFNARRRERRAAQRYIDKANKSSGATRNKYLQIAREHYENAMRTYDPTTKQDFAAQMKRIAAELGEDIYKYRKQYENMTGKKQELMRKQYEESRKEQEKQSFEALESKLKDDVFRREKEANIILNSPVGKRIMAGLVDVWSGAISKGNTADENRRLAESAIFEYFNADNWADVISAIEETIGESLYQLTGEDDFYEVVKTLIQTKVAANTLIAA